MIFNGLTELNLSTNLDYAFVLKEVHKSVTSFQVNIPRVMPMIPIGTPQDTPKNVSASILVNAAACKPKSNGTVTLCNYHTINLYQGVLPPIIRQTGYDWDVMIPVNSRILCMIVNNSIDDIFALM